MMTLAMMVAALSFTACGGDDDETIRVSNKTMMYFKSMVWIMLVMVIDASLLTNLHGICLNIVEILGCHVVIYQMHKKANTTTNSCTLFT